MHVENGELTLEEKFSFWRTSLEVFYREPITPSLLITDNKGRQRCGIRLYEALKEAARNPSLSDEIVLPYDRNLFKRTHLSVLTDLNARILLLHELLQTTPIYRNGTFLDGVEYHHGDLAQFAKTAVQMKPYIEGQLGITVRQDVRKKPTQFLGLLLSKLNVLQKPSGQKTVGGGKFMHYKISALSLDFLEEVSKRRIELDGWKFIREHYGFEDMLEDMEYLVGRAA